MTAIEIVHAGVATTVQDRGRPGLAHLGVTTSGAVDPATAATLNRLVGNPHDAAVLETCGGLCVRALTTLTIATSHEPAPRTLRAGALVTLPPDPQRTWLYLAVRGGVDVVPVLGSRATDTLSGIGPPPPSAGDRVAVGHDPGTPILADVGPLRPPTDRATVTAGPRADWFDVTWQERFVATTWTVRTSSRVGVRLTGLAIERTVTRELPSEGLVRGAIQVPPDGDPVMMLADHPTTGGYPVIAVVDPDDVAAVAQRPAGATVRFRV